MSKLSLPGSVKISLPGWYLGVVTELVYLSERLIAINDHKSKNKIKSILTKMSDALFHTIKPNNQICKIGDSDDAVVFKFSENSSEYPEWMLQKMKVKRARVRAGL